MRVPELHRLSAIRSPRTAGRSLRNPATETQRRPSQGLPSQPSPHTPAMAAALARVLVRLLVLACVALPARGFAPPLAARRTCGALAAKKKSAKSSKGKASKAKPVLAWAAAGAAPKPPKTAADATAGLWAALRTGADVRPFLAAGASPSAPDADGYPPLHAACRAGRADAAAALLEAGAAVEAAAGGGGVRPLHLAALAGFADVVAALLAAGAEVDAVDEGDVGGTALQYAANAGAHGAIDALLAAGASVDATSRDGRSVLHFASFSPDPAVADKLLAAGAPPLPKAAPWPRERDPLEVLGVFGTYAEVQPTEEAVPLLASSSDVLEDHAVLHFADYDGPGGALAVHRFRVRDGATGPAGAAFDDNLARAATLLRAGDPDGALRSNGGGYHSAATLRGRPEAPGLPCWGELHAILDAAAEAALACDAAAGRAPPKPAGGPAVEVTDSWVNLNKGRGDYNKLHSHLPAAYSGTYYAQPPRGDGRLNGAFVVPLTTADGDAALDYALMRPVRGMLFLFPAGMLHGVLPTYADGQERVSIGFNVSPGW